MFEQLDEHVVGRITFPFVNYLFNRRGILNEHRQLMESQWYSEDVLRDLQLKRFRRLLRYANKWCPFYTDRFKESGLVPEDIQSLEEIKLIPPLTRQDLSEHHKEMVDIRYRSSILASERCKRGLGQPIPFAVLRRHKLIRNTSSGSTGAPVIYYEDGSTTALNWAQELRVKEWYGLGPGVREARMRPISTEYDPSSKALLMRKHLWLHLVLPGMNLAEVDYYYCLERINEFQPKILFGITTALAGLADYIRCSKGDVSLHRPDLVITWAAPLYAHEKDLLEEVFECPVTNIYSAREVGHIAALCPHGSMHISQERFIVESEGSAQDDSGSGCGEILVTALNESPMPFIRYRVGDIGKVVKGDCQCGRTLQVLRDLLGRTGEVFFTTDGHMIAPNFWCLAFMSDITSHSVEKFQVIYRKNGSVHLRIIKKSSYSAETEADLRRFFCRHFQSGIHFQFEYVSRIDPGPSGKYQVVIREADA